MPQPQHSDLHRFCEIDGWEEITSGRRNPDHARYRKVLANGEVLRTRVSHGRGAIEDPSLWRHIWRDQLGLESEEEFWEVLSSRTPVERSAAQGPQGPSKPAWLENQLIYTAGIPESEVAAMSEEEAFARWNEFCSKSG